VPYRTRETFSPSSIRKFENDQIDFVNRSASGDCCRFERNVFQSNLRFFSRFSAVKKFQARISAVSQRSVTAAAELSFFSANPQNRFGKFNEFLEILFPKFKIILKVLEIKHLTFSYRRETPILDDVSLTAQTGDFCVLIGSNGTGKSTLLKLFLRQLTPDSGEIRLFGEELASFRGWSRVGYVPQGHSYLNSDFPATVEEILLAHQFPRIGLFGRVRRSHREKVTEVLKLVDMIPFRTARLGTLSGGQLQRILIARALVNDPELLILDEPTTGIDVQNAHALYELLDRINREFRLTILMVTHDLIHAVNYASRIFCLEDGNLAEISPCQLQHELIHRHHHDRKDDACEHVQALEKRCQECVFYQKCVTACHESSFPESSRGMDHSCVVEQHASSLGHSRSGVTE